MSPVDRLDALLRTDLHRADTLPVEDKYEAVLARSAQRTRRRRATAVAGVVAAVALVAGGVGSLQQLRESSAPPAVSPGTKLTGTWSRLVYGERWTIAFESGSVLRVDAPASSEDVTGSDDGASYRTDAGVVRIDAFVNGACADGPSGAYQWTLSGSTVLELQADAEPCGRRLDVFAGTWTSVP